MKVVAVIQARMGSTRLPGKIMLPLNCKPVLTHVIKRTKSADVVNEVVVATSENKRDDIVAYQAKQDGATVYRGSEDDVLGRMFKSAQATSADIVIRITSDCPLISPDVLDYVVTQLEHLDVDYSANILERTFPRGLDVEAFTFDSFRYVETQSNEKYQREHVTPYYTENQSEFEVNNVSSDEIFNTDTFVNRTDLRVTLDELDDYILLKEVYEGVPYEDILNICEAIDYIDQNDLTGLNSHVEQIKLNDLR